jgi:hypothetical protein
MPAPKFATAAEYRSYVDGAGEVISAVLSNAADLWKMGRDAYELESLRDDMQIRLAALADALSEARKLESP